MEIINRRQRMISLTRKLRQADKSIGFVPTMGALHQGHLELIQQARQMCDVVIISIFVNPTQFNEAEDFEKYPRDLTADTALLAEYNVDYIFSPDADEIYGEDFSTFVTVDDISEKLEGASRPGHFRGVATVITILFNTIRPDFAFFGQKDAQQLAVIKRLTKNLGFETEIVVVPTVRENSGLAMSSRNERLTNEQRIAAAVIYKALSNARSAVIKGESNTANLAEAVRRMIASEPLASVDYVAVVDNETLETLDKVGDDPVLIAVAASFGNTRLIDNIVLNQRQ